jgi:hypothetical protein
MVIKNKNEFSLLKRKTRRGCPFGNQLGNNTPTAVYQAVIPEFWEKMTRKIVKRFTFFAKFCTIEYLHESC